MLRAAKIWAAIVGDDHPDYANALAMAGDVSIELKDYGRAEELFRRVITVDRRTFGNDSIRFAGGLLALAHILIEREKLQEAEAVTQHAIWLNERTAGSNIKQARNQAAYALRNLAEISIRYGDLEAANTYLEQSLSIYERICPPRSLAFALILDRHAEVLRKLDDVERAAAIEDRIASIRMRIK